MIQLHCNWWSDITYITFLRCFLVRLSIPWVLSCSGIKLTQGFFLISNLAVTALITIDFTRTIFFSSESSNRNKLLSLHLDLKYTLSLQYGKCLSILCLSLVLKSSEIIPKYKITKANSLLWTKKVRYFLINDIFKQLSHWCTKIHSRRFLEN